MYIVVLITSKDTDEANRIAEALVSEKLIACANIISDVKSIFWWQGKVDRADEVLLVLKTQKEHFSIIVDRVKSYHSYEVPEIIALPIVEGNEDYLNWIKESTS